MFQNIKEGQAKGKHRGAGVFANVFSIQNIPLYIISFMTSIVGVGTGGQVSPFGISMMAANARPIISKIPADIANTEKPIPCMQKRTTLTPVSGM